MTKAEIKQETKNKEQFLEQVTKYKNEYIEKNSIESMVYENGAATALLFKEVQQLSQLVKTLINGKDETTDKS